MIYVGYPKLIIVFIMIFWCIEPLLYNLKIWNGMVKQTCLSEIYRESSIFIYILFGTNM